jgi:hypothetical protein
MSEAQRADDLHAFIEADHVFHHRLYEASQRDRLIRNISELVDRSRRYAPYAYRAWQPLDVGIAAHRPILEAIEARDPALVERLTLEHMSAAAVRLVSAVQRETDERALALRRRGAHMRTADRGFSNAPPADRGHEAVMPGEMTSRERVAAALRREGPTVPYCEEYVSRPFAERLSGGAGP